MAAGGRGGAARPRRSRAGEAPYVEEWKPLPPRLHDFVEVERPAPRGRFAISVRDVRTGLDLAEARAYAASAGARLPTEDEWLLMGDVGLLRRQDQQFHWTSQGYAGFDDFLAALERTRSHAVLRDTLTLSGDSGALARLAAQRGP